MDDTKALHGKTALITGAAKRIGAVIAGSLHSAGMDVVIHYRNARVEAEALVADFNAKRPGSALALQADLLDLAVLPWLIEETRAFKGRLDALINNASSFYPTPLYRITEAEWNDLIGTNLKAPLFLARHAAPELRRTGGCIVNLADIYGLRPLKDYSLYSTAKAGLIMLTLVLAKELAPEVRVNAVAPGAALWPEDMQESARQEILARTPLKRAGRPEDVAAAALYLVRDAEFTTGQVLTVDGGRSIAW